MYDTPKIPKKWRECIMKWWKLLIKKAFAGEILCIVGLAFALFCGICFIVVYWVICLLIPLAYIGIVVSMVLLLIKWILY
jgi:hypothetical protein